MEIQLNITDFIKTDLSFEHCQKALLDMLIITIPEYHNRMSIITTV